MIRIHIILFLIFLLISNSTFAEKSKNTILSNDLTSFKWGMSQAEFMTAEKDNYGKPLHDKNEANIFTSNAHVMIANLPFNEIVKIQSKKGLSAVNFMNISNKETFDENCKNIYNFMVSSFAKPTYQAVNSNPTSSFYVWNDLKGTTLYEFCFSESELQTVIVTSEPKWKVINCKLENNGNEYHFFYDDMNKQVREFAENYIGIVLHAKVSKNIIEFATEKNSSQAIVNQNDLSFSIKSKDGKIEKGHCSLQ
ncbi:MAG: hypothetical protein JSR17_10395 [Proteobacteria bacterium]|nr:hypothetical protein [Pseudomonadota bacterium]